MIFQNQSPQAAETLSLRLQGRGYKIGPHFKLSEMASKDGADKVKVHPALIALLEVIRAHFDKPVIINSGYRTESHNRRIGGASSSQHLTGMAADIRLPGIPPEDVATYAEKLDAGGVGRYSTWTHVDIKGAERRWSG